MHASFPIVVTLLFNSVSNASALRSREISNTTAVVNFGNCTGSPHQLAAGAIYGIPWTPDQIPSHFYQDMRFNYGRGGGAQLPAPARGWTWDLTEYYNRLNATLSHYHTVRQYNGNFIFQFGNLWGSDGTENSSMPYPGDNGDWSYYYEFLAQVIRDLKARHALEALSFEPWNEADGSWAWKRPMSQFMEMFVRSVQYVRDEVPGVPVIGPTFYGPPKRSSTWWTTFMQTVATNSCIPDQWTWHMLNHEENMLSSNNELEALLQTYNLPRRPLNIDEYSPFAEQVPAGSAWWISQFERMDAIALRSNWLDRSELWDFLASLLWKPNPTDATSRGYWPNGDYQVYKYYGSDMRSGYRVGTIPSGDMNLDTFAVVGDDGVVRVLAGVHNVVGMWHVELRGLSKLGLAPSGDLSVRTLSFPFNSSNSAVHHPDDLGWARYSYSGDFLTIPIQQIDNVTAHAFEFEFEEDRNHWLPR